MEIEYLFLEVIVYGISLIVCVQRGTGADLSMSIPLAMIHVAKQWGDARSTVLVRTITPYEKPLSTYLRALHGNLIFVCIVFVAALH